MIVLFSPEVQKTRSHLCASVGACMSAPVPSLLERGLYNACHFPVTSLNVLSSNCVTLPSVTPPPHTHTHTHTQAQISPSTPPGHHAGCHCDKAL